MCLRCVTCALLSLSIHVCLRLFLSFAFLGSLFASFVTSFSGSCGRSSGGVLPSFVGAFVGSFIRSFCASLALAFLRERKKPPNP